jgi:hypothetical protein
VDPHGLVEYRGLPLGAFAHLIRTGGDVPTLAEAEERLAQEALHGLTFFSVWAPGAEWHRNGLAYGRHEGWREAFARNLQARKACEIRRLREAA